MLVAPYRCWLQSLVLDTWYNTSNSLIIYETAQSGGKCIILRDCSGDVPKTAICIGLNVKLRYQLLMYINKVCRVPFINFVLPA